MKNILGMCFNPRVLAAVGIVALGVWLVAPQALLAALPLLLIAVCPLSMVLMAWMMRGSMNSPAAPDPATRLAALKREQVKLAEEVARTRAELEANGARSARQEALPEPSRADR